MSMKKNLVVETIRKARMLDMLAAGKGSSRSNWHNWNTCCRV